MITRLMTCSEVSRLLNLSAFTVYRMAEHRKIPHLRIGRKLLFDRPRIEKWLESRTVGERRGAEGVR